MIHPPRQPHHVLPPEFPDQLSHAIMKPRTIKPMKSCAYSNSFQMHEQRGSFNGIDTCNLASFGNFDYCSKLLHDSESRSIGNRPDINALLNKLCDENKITVKYANSMRQSAKDMGEEIDFEKYIYGSTYVPLEAAMILQREINERPVKVVWDERGVDENGNELSEVTYHVRRM